MSADTPVDEVKRLENEVLELKTQVSEMAFAVGELATALIGALNLALAVKTGDSAEEVTRVNNAARGEANSAFTRAADILKASGTPDA